MVHISLAVLFIQTVDSLRIAYGTESCNCKNLSLTSCKKTRTVNSGKNAYLSGKRTYLIDTPAVNTFALIEPVPYNFLLKFVNALVDHCNFFGVLLVKLFMNLVLDRIKTLFTDIFVVCIESSLDFLAHKFFNSIEQLVVYLHGLKLKLFLSDLLLDIRNESNYLFDFIVTCHDCFEHCIVIDLIRTRFDHNNFFHCTRNGKVKIRLLTLFKSRIEDNLTVNKSHADTADRTVPRDIRNGNSNRSRDHTAYFGRIIGIN